MSAFLMRVLPVHSFFDRALYQTKTPIKFASGVLSEVLYVAYGRLSLCVTHDVRHRRIQLIGELSSSLGASSLKNFSTVSGCHSLSETMLFVSEREWQPLTVEKFLREDAPREELSSPIN